jgi:voltage-gated potassium channel
MFDNSRRQLRLSLLIILTLIPIGTIGMVIFNHNTLGEAFYFTIVTLATVGYGDVVPRTPEARAFVAILIPFGLSAFAFALQAIYFYLFANPVLNEIRYKRALKRAIDRMERHYILTGKGEIVTQTLEYVHQIAPRTKPDSKLKQALINVVGFVTGKDYLREGIIGALVVVTTDEAYAKELRAKGILTIVGNPTEEAVLVQAGIERAKALLVLSDDDTETLLTVLAGRTVNRTILITATVLDDAISAKIVQVGANQVVPPYQTAGTFLNSATLRPAVNAFFSSVGFDMNNEKSFLDVQIGEDSEWVGRTLGSLDLANTYKAYVIGIRYANGLFGYAPRHDYVLQHDDVLIFVGRLKHITEMRQLANTQDMNNGLWQMLPTQTDPVISEKMYEWDECEPAIQKLNKHFVICGTGLVAHRAIDALNPSRPFVIVDRDRAALEEFRERGFRVVCGDTSDPTVMLKAGVKRAQAVMVTLEDEAKAVLTILTCRTLNKHLLITALSYKDESAAKLERVGADRVVSPFQIAARFLMLATVSPYINAFIHYVLYNVRTGLEMTELYTETDSPWIGATIGSLKLFEMYEAGIVGVRLDDKKTFHYAPSEDRIINAHEVLIVITPMQHSDLLREIAHGHESKRPSTLRTRVQQSSKWSREEIMKMVNAKR